jgi:hypothetical protein
MRYQIPGDHPPIKGGKKGKKGISVNREQCGHMGGKRFSLFVWLND